MSSVSLNYTAAHKDLLCPFREEPADSPAAGATWAQRRAALSTRRSCGLLCGGSFYLDWWPPQWELAAGCSSPPVDCNEPDVSGSTELAPPPGSGRCRLDSLNLRCSSVRQQHIRRMRLNMNTKLLMRLGTF